MSAYSLTVVPTFDSSITKDPNGPAMIAGITAAIAALQDGIANNFTVYINYVNDPSVELGENTTWINNYAYSRYLAALRKSASDADDTNALRKLPNSSVDPVVGGADIVLPLPLARLLGLDSGEGPDGFDATVNLNMSLMNFTRPPRQCQQLRSPGRRRARDGRSSGNSQRPARFRHHLGGRFVSLHHQSPTHLHHQRRQRLFFP
jgi:hypothetical protein